MQLVWMLMYVADDVLHFSTLFCQTLLFQVYLSSSWLVDVG